ncbi:MAG: hypothetical protein ACLFV7_06295 [Phycisphaerae bacterium]
MTRATQLRTSLAMLVLAALFPSALSAAGGDLDMHLVLKGALHRGDPAENAYDLHTEAFQRDEVWGFVYGTALNFDNGEHIGRVDEFSKSGDTIKAKIHILIMGDPWTKGGRADIELTAKATGKREGQYSGTFTCTFLEKVSKGDVKLTLAPPPALPDGHKPVEPGEHPRMLFRKHELPALRKKMKTPFGQAAVKRLKKNNDAVSKGLLYQLTGEKKYAEEAWKAVKKEKADFGPGAFSLGHAWGPRITQIATAYDLCYDAWDSERHAELATYFDQVVPMLYWQLKRITRKANWHPCSNYSGPMRGAGAIGSLVMYGTPSDKPEKPEEPQTHKTVAPAKNYTPGKKVPVHDYTDANMPQTWIYVGGFYPRIGEQVLDPTQARPAPGEKVTYRDQKDTWRYVSDEKDKGYWTTGGMMGGKKMIDITNAVDRAYDSTNYFYTVVRNDKPRWVRLKADYGEATFYLNGAKVEEGGYAKIEKGSYPILVKAPIGRCEPWGRHLMQPKLIEVAESEAKAYLDKRRRQYEQVVKDWQYACKVWEARGKIDVRYLQWLHLGRRHMMRYYRQGIGTGGFQPETGSYSAISVREPMLYASMYQKMFGHDVTRQQDIELFLPRKLMAMIFRDDGKIIAQDINGTPHLSTDHVVRGFPIVPEQYKPAVLWYWLRDVKAQGNPARVLGTMTPFAFERFPLEAKPKHPRAVLPLTWHAETFGYFCMRNAWEGKDDFVFQAFAKAHPIGGWNHPNAGTIRLVGLGHVWATGPSSRGADRWQEPVVNLPADDIQRGACGIVTYSKLDKDGSGAVTIDMSEVYSARMDGEKKVTLYDRHGYRLPNAKVDLGIEGFRAVAIDYSGKSGAPCLMAVADKIAGAKETVWKWQLPGEKSKDRQCKVRLGKGEFTMEYDDATLKATFLAPADVKLELAEGRREYKIKAGSKGGQMTTREVNAIHATSKTGTYFVVFTIQRKNAPSVTVNGRGLKASATVGGQTVRWDGTKIVIGK